MPDLIDSIPLLDGHADVWRIFRDQSVFLRVVTQLASPFLTEGITKVASVEARGFILGPAVGMQVKAGFLAIRKPGGVYPGPLIEWPTGPDWRNMNHVLRIQRHALLPTNRVLLIDDWIETGSQALAARALIEAGGATFVGTPGDHRSSAEQRSWTPRGVPCSNHGWRTWAQSIRALTQR